MAKEGYLPSWQFFGAQVLGPMISVPVEEIRGLIRRGGPYYTRAVIPKSGGGSRELLIPIPELMRIQRAILDEILMNIWISDIAHGGLPETSIVTNAKPHRNSHSMLCLDIKDAFGTTTVLTRSRDHCKLRPSDIGTMSDRVRWLLQFFTHAKTVRRQWRESAPRYNWHIRQYEPRPPYIHVESHRFLPQGAPTSTALFNIACRWMDGRLIKLAASSGSTVTRFVDNICFSVGGDTFLGDSLVSAVIRIVHRAGFEINHNKTLVVRNGNTEGIPLSLPGVNIVGGRLMLRPRQIERHRMSLYCALMSGDMAVVNGVMGHIGMIYGNDIPRRIAQVFEKFAKEGTT